MRIWECGVRFMQVLWHYMCIWDIGYRVICLHVCVLLGSCGVFGAYGELCVYLFVCVYSRAMAFGGIFAGAMSLYFPLGSY